MQCLTGDDTAARAFTNTRFYEITGETAGNTSLLPSFHRFLIDHARISMTFYTTDDSQQANTQGAVSDQRDAIIAPLLPDDSFNHAAVADLVEHLVGAGVHGIILGGTG